MDIDSLVELGKKLQLSGKELAEFVREQQKVAREDRAIERAVKKKKEKKQSVKENMKGRT